MEDVYRVCIALLLLDGFFWMTELLRFHQFGKII